ncbi:hypothetical protein QR680_018498 [Steinernema hermaphroditum]|uniref:Uncharacterized protein n=1 Tax=Steinernema hermaphroditum TaxID=289476 RepID=A0AA39HI55_9BILA|nr:hypothetical protein QR680_018498 [Steinernema hermaphroditum]
MNFVPALFVRDVLRLLPTPDYEKLSLLSQKGTFSRLATKWVEKWFRCYILLTHNAGSKKFEYCQLRSNAPLDEVPYDLSILEDFVLDKSNIAYMHEYVVKILPQKPLNGKRELIWISADAHDQKLRSHMNAIRVAPSAALVVNNPVEVEDFDPTVFFKLFPRNCYFNDILTDDFYHDSIHVLINASVETGKVSYVTCNQWVQKCTMKFLLKLFRQKQFTGILWPEDSEKKPFARKLTKKWLRDVDAFTKEKSLYSVKPLFGFEKFPFRRLAKMPDSVLQKSAIHELYAPQEQAFFQMRHPEKRDRKIVLHLGARAQDFSEVSSFREALEMHTWFDLYIQ